MALMIMAIGKRLPRPASQAGCDPGPLRCVDRVRGTRVGDC